MLFTGHSEHTIDAKQRLAIPAKYRNQWDVERDGSAWYCVPWPTGHLRLFTETTFQQLANQAESSLTPGEEEADLESDFYGFAERIEPDSAGRINVPNSHIELLGLPQEVVIVGARTRLEVHPRERWKEAAAERFRRLPDLVRRIENKRRPSS